MRTDPTVRSHPLKCEILYQVVAHRDEARSEVISFHCSVLLLQPDGLHFRLTEKNVHIKLKDVAGFPFSINLCSRCLRFNRLEYAAFYFVYQILHAL